MPKISVIIPVYNVEKYIEECLDSILTQTLEDIEIICINDGSTDNSGKILDQYASKEARIEVIHKTNEGAATARNIGMQRAKGEFVIFFDADDYMQNNALEKLYTNIVKNNAQIAICRSFEFQNMQKKYKKLEYTINNALTNDRTCFSSDEISKYIFQFCNGWAWDKLYRHNFIKENFLTFQNLRHSNDTKFVLLSLACAKKITIIDDYLLYHRKHPNSLEETRKEAPDCFYYALIELMNSLKNKGLYEKYKQSFINYCFTFPYWHINSVNNGNAKQEMIKKYKELLKEIEFERYEKKYFYNKKLYSHIKRELFGFIKWENIFAIKNEIQNGSKIKVLTILNQKIKLYQYEPEQ